LLPAVLTTLILSLMDGTMKYHFCDH